MVADEEEYEVEEIIDSKLVRNQLKYLVKWKGYTDENNSWEPASGFAHAPLPVAAFHQRHPDATAPPHLIAAAVNALRRFHKGRSSTHFRLSPQLFSSLPFRPLLNFTDHEETTLHKLDYRYGPNGRRTAIEKKNTLEVVDDLA
jgi:chromodomain-containing protein